MWQRRWACRKAISARSATGLRSHPAVGPSFPSRCQLSCSLSADCSSSGFTPVFRPRPFRASVQGAQVLLHLSANMPGVRGQPPPARSNKVMLSLARLVAKGPGFLGVESPREELPPVLIGRQIGVMRSRPGRDRGDAKPRGQRAWSISSVLERSRRSGVFQRLQTMGPARPTAGVTCRPWRIW